MRKKQHSQGSLQFILAAFALLMLTNCTTELKARSPSEFLYTTDQNTTTLFNDVKEKLEGSNYAIKKMDVTAGVLVADPRKFTFDYENQKVSGQQIIHFRQEGGSLKIRIAYKCKYPDEPNEGACYGNEPATAKKIKRLESALLKELEPLFSKTGKKDVRESFEEDWGVEETDPKTAPKK